MCPLQFKVQKELVKANYGDKKPFRCMQSITVEQIQNLWVDLLFCAHLRFFKSSNYTSHNPLSDDNIFRYTEKLLERIEILQRLLGTDFKNFFCKNELLCGECWDNLNRSDFTVVNKVHRIYYILYFVCLCTIYVICVCCECIITRCLNY